MTIIESPGLNYDLTDEQQLFRRSVRDFVTIELPKDYCREVEAREAFPEDLWKKLADQGLHGIAIPEEYGGQGGSIIEQMIVAEELARTMAGLVWLWGITAFAGVKCIGTFGTEEQKREYLPKVAAGEIKFAIALTEPDGGTDVLGSMRTRAVRTDGGWIVNGTKIWSTMAHVADKLLLVARTQAETKRPSEGISVFLIDARSPGITATQIPKLGMRAVGSCELQLENVFVPDGTAVGEIDRGWRLLAETLNSERILVSAQCCGVLQGILEDMVSYANERVAFGQTIGAFQAVQHKIADTAMSLETAKLHAYRAGWLLQRGQPAGVAATMAKVISSELAFKAADDGMQILGGYAYALEYDMQRYWRDIRLFRIAPINNEMGRNMIGESLGLPRAF